MRRPWPVTPEKIIRTLQLLEQVCEDPWLFFEAKRFPRAKSLGSTVRGNLETETKILFITSKLLPNPTRDKTT